MSDLISRSALIEKLEEKMFDSKLMCPVIKLTDLIELIDEQPTAYDVEKVVAELEEETDCPNCSMHCVDAHMCGFDEMRKQAIDIVKRGGVE